MSIVNVLDAIRDQRAVRDFDGRAIDPDHLDAILQAGAWAPSSKNEQRWAFIAITDRETLQALSGVGDYTQHLATAPAAIALVHPRVEDVEERESIAMDLGQAIQSMMLAAWDLGIGSAHASVYVEPRAQELLGYPATQRCDTLISFGYPADPSILTRGKSPRSRKPLSDTVHREHWSR